MEFLVTCRLYVCSHSGSLLAEADRFCGLSLAAIDSIRDDVVLVTLAHGIHYQLLDASFEEAEDLAVAVAPSALLAPPHAGGLENEMNELQLRYERAQGLWGFERAGGASSASVCVVHR